MRKIFILPSLILILIVIIGIEAVILLQRQHTSNKTTLSINTPRPNTTQIKVPEQKGRQAVYIAETTGLQSASASLVYQGSIKDSSLNTASQVVKLVIDIPDVEEDATFYFDEAIITRISKIQNTDVKKFTAAQELQEALRVGEDVEVIFEYNLLTDTIISVTIEQI